MVAVVTGGVLFQAPCATSGAELVGGVSVSIANQLIRNIITEALGLSAGLSSFAT